MVKPKFNDLENLSETNKAGYSDLVWRELLVANHNFINHCFHQTEEQTGSITKSLQNWIVRRDFTEYKEKDSSGKIIVAEVKLGDIFIADLGLSYETAYTHPILVVDYVDDKILVVPITSATAKVNNAYHPLTNHAGDKTYRKVYSTDGFDIDSALIIDSPMIIRKGRLLERKGKLNEDISNNGSIFQEVRNNLFKLLFNDFYNHYQDTLSALQVLEKENEQLKSQFKK